MEAATSPWSSNIGNNGMARNPHTHVGAWREATKEPLQIRWDLTAMAHFHSNDE